MIIIKKLTAVKKNVKNKGGVGQNKSIPIEAEVKVGIGDRG